MSQSDLSTIEANYPSTFRERGVSAPFTAPLLAGARVRDTARSGIEFVVANSSGRKGVYVLPRSAAEEAYRPTLHDSVLLQRLADAGPLHPRTVRSIAWDVAREGLAGRGARAVAVAVGDADRARCQRARSWLSTVLTEQTLSKDPKFAASLDGSSAAGRQASELLDRLIPGFARSGLKADDTITALAAIFAPLGMTPNDPDSLVNRRIEQLQVTRDQLAGMFPASGQNDWIGLAQSLIASMDTTLAIARSLNSDTRALLGDPLALVKHWIATPARLAAAVTRAEWVLDGWERVALVWQCTHGDIPRRAALPEMAQLVPVLPREVMEWAAVAVPRDALDPVCRVTSHRNNWRTGRLAFAQIGRNERLLAMHQ